MHTIGLEGPVLITVAHTHQPDITRKQKLINDVKYKQMAESTKENPRDIMINVQKCDDEDVVVKNSNYENIRQVISRVRKEKSGYGANAKTLDTIIIPDNLKNTYRGSLFYYSNSGVNDPNRVLIFTTDENLRLLEKHGDWYCDGTFSITPVLFYQLYTIHIVVNNKDLPLVYGFLPNKTQATYIKFFRMIKSFISKDPISVNVDFEKSVFNGIKKVFVNTHIYGCYFHLTQNFWRKMTKLGMLEKYYSSSECKNGFLMLKALAYVPESDVGYVFRQLKKFLGKSFSELLKYVSKYYIGTKSRGARFPIPTWNLYSRVLANMPKTNNNVESWHNVFTVHEKKHLTINC